MVSLLHILLLSRACDPKKTPISGNRTFDCAHISRILSSPTSPPRFRKHPSFPQLAARCAALAACACRQASLGAGKLSDSKPGKLKKTILEDREYRDPERPTGVATAAAGPQRAAPRPVGLVTTPSEPEPFLPSWCQMGVEEVEKDEMEEMQEEEEA